MRIYTRSEWGAKNRAGTGARAVGKLRVFKHHSVATHLPATATLEQEFAAMRELEAIGQSRFGYGISYTFVIFPSGRIHEGTGIGRIGTHTAGFNTGAAAICLAGNYEAKDQTKASIEAVGALLDYGEGRWWPTKTFAFDPHQKVKATACPGKHGVANMPKERAIATGDLTTTPGPDDWTGALGLHELRLGATGPEVGIWQDFLRSHGLVIDRDEAFGRATVAATMKWQKANGLFGDGVVGIRSQEKALAVGPGQATPTGPSDGATAPAPPAPAQPAPSLPSHAVGSRVIVRGMTGTDVKRLQEVLNKWYPGLPRLEEDGVDGALTEARVKYFQRKAGLREDGKAGPATLGKLGF